MTRRVWLLAAPTALSCGRPGKTSGFSFPSAFGPDWKLTSTEKVPSSDAPAEVRQLGLRAATRAQYQGKDPLKVTVYQMTSEGGAFELRQKHRPDEGFLAFHRGDLFIVIESAAMDNHELVAAAEAFEDSLGKVQP